MKSEIESFLEKHLSKEEYSKALKYKSRLFENKVNTFSQALKNAFIWGNTDEGYEYWKNVCNRLCETIPNQYEIYSIYRYDFNDYLFNHKHMSRIKINYAKNGENMSYKAEYEMEYLDSIGNYREYFFNKIKEKEIDIIIF